MVPSGSAWHLKHNGAVISNHTNKAPAVSAGQTKAKANMPSQLVVHRVDGTIELEWTYGHDPFPPSG